MNVRFVEIELRSDDGGDSNQKKRNSTNRYLLDYRITLSRSADSISFQFDTSSFRLDDSPPKILWNAPPRLSKEDS